MADFWNEALRLGGVSVSENGRSAVCRPLSDGTYLEFVQVPEGKTVKNRLHFGCSAGGLIELDAEIERLRSLGATVAWEEEFPPATAARYRNIILRDIEGNEFCLGAGDSQAGET